jgi:hypothetical protein
MTDDALSAAAEAAAAREARLGQLEQAVKRLQPKTKDPWEKLQAVSPLISGLLVVIVGYFLTGSVNNAIQRQQLQLSNVKEMRELIVQLNSNGCGEAQSAALTLSAFGRPAVPPLVSVLVSGGDECASAAEQALRGIGLGDPGAVCEPARKLLDSRSGLVSWVACLSVIRLLGDMECTGVRPSVEAFARAVEAAGQKPGSTPPAWRVAPSPALDPIVLGLMKKELERTLKVIRP